MRIALGVVCSAFWLLYLGQIVTVVSLPLAQRLGLQEKPSAVDPIFTRLELWTARWDLCWLWTLPVAGVLILIDHVWWPQVALVGGSAYVDTGGREAAKMWSLLGRGVAIGSPRERRVLAITYVLFVMVGAMAIVVGLVQLSA